MNDTNDNFQQRFFERLSNRFPSRAELVRRVGETINVGRDAVYRRFRGETRLTVDEMIILSRAFDIQPRLGLADVERKNVSTGLRYPDQRGDVRDPEAYITFLRHQLDMMRELPELSFDFATPELPIYYEFYSPLLFTFKMFIHGITTWDVAGWRETKFRPDLLDPRLHRSVRQAIREQYAFEARELWSIGVLDVTLRQISYVAQINRFSDPDDAHRLLDELLTIIDHLELMAKKGKRFYPGEEAREDSPNFCVYHNELSNTNNVALFTSRDHRFLFTTLVSPSYIATADDRYCNSVHRWFEKLIEHGNPLHSAGGKYAAQYFGRLRRQVEHCREQVKMGQSAF